MGLSFYHWFLLKAADHTDNTYHSRMGGTLLLLNSYLQLHLVSGEG